MFLQIIIVINVFKEVGFEFYIGKFILGFFELLVLGGKNGFWDLFGIYDCEFLDYEMDIGGCFFCLMNVGFIFVVVCGMDFF